VPQRDFRRISQITIALLNKVSRSTGKRPDLFLRSKADGQRTIVDFKYCLDAKPAHLKTAGCIDFHDVAPFSVGGSTVESNFLRCLWKGRYAAAARKSWLWTESF
jgi:hypothetical protein